MWSDFGRDPDHHAECLIRNPAIKQQGIDFDKIFVTALQWYKEQLITFWG